MTKSAHFHVHWTGMRFIITSYVLAKFGKVRVQFRTLCFMWQLDKVTTKAPKTTMVTAMGTLQRLLPHLHITVSHQMELDNDRGRVVHMCSGFFFLGGATRIQ